MCLQNVTAYANSLTGPVIAYAFSPRGSDANWFGLHKLGGSFVGYIVVSAVCGGQVVRDCVALWLTYVALHGCLADCKLLDDRVINLLYVPVNAAQ